MIANPLVRFLENKIKIMRKHGTVIVIVLVLALICAAIYGIISFIVVQTSLLIDDLPSVYESVVNNIQQAMSVLHEKINISRQMYRVCWERKMCSSTSIY